MKNPPRLAIWDIDGTLARPSLERQFVAFLLAKRWLRPARLAGNALGLSLRWPPPRTFQVKQAYVRHEPVDRVSEWVEAWWAESGERHLLPGASQALRGMGERGVELLLLSGTADFLASRVARHFGIAQYIAGRSQIRDGRYTGALEAPHPHGRFKQVYAEEWLRGRCDSWQGVWALGDHEGDVALLERAEVAVAVNPRPGLQVEAQRRGWTVVTDRDLPLALLQWS